MILVFIRFFILFFMRSSITYAKDSSQILSIYSETTPATHIIINTNFKPNYKTVQTNERFTLILPKSALVPKIETITLAGVLKQINVEQSADNTSLTFTNFTQTLAQDFKIQKLTEHLWQLSFNLKALGKQANYYKNLANKDFLAKLTRPHNGAKDHKFTVVLDPGHGGIDSGAIAKDGMLEKNITLTFAKILQHKLAENPNINVVLTREDDRYLYLDERVSKAREAGVDLFISIHADIINSSKIHGTTVYTLSKKSSDNIAKSLEYSQNKVDDLKKENKPKLNPLEDIFVNLTKRETTRERTIIVQQLIKNIKGQKIFMINHPNRYANFKVLKALDFPSVLIELGYLSNKNDEKRISNLNWQRKMAKAIAISVENFRKLRSF